MVPKNLRQNPESIALRKRKVPFTARLIQEGNLVAGRKRSIGRT